MKRGFTVLSKSWYADACLDGVDHVDEIKFGLYNDNGDSGSDCAGEMAMKWHKTPAAPRLEAFDDSWAVLATFTDVIKAMGRKNDLNITPDQFAEILVGLGFEDRTEIKPPNWEKVT